MVQAGQATALQAISGTRPTPDPALSFDTQGDQEEDKRRASNMLEATDLEVAKNVPWAPSGYKGG